MATERKRERVRRTIQNIKRSLSQHEKIYWSSISPTVAADRNNKVRTEGCFTSLVSWCEVLYVQQRPTVWHHADKLSNCPVNLKWTRASENDSRAWTHSDTRSWKMFSDSTLARQNPQWAQTHLRALTQLHEEFGSSLKLQNAPLRGSFFWTPSSQFAPSSSTSPLSRSEPSSTLSLTSVAAPPPPQLPPRPNDSLWLNAVETTRPNTSKKRHIGRTKEDAHLHHHEGEGETSNTSHLDEKAQHRLLLLRELQQAQLWFYRSQDGAPEPGPWRF